jgi:hydroxymethylglutaryl-CoA reductase
LTVDSKISGFFRLSIEERIQQLIERRALSADDGDRLRRGQFVLPQQTADKMIENVVGVFGLPLAVAANFRINDRDWLVPMVVEEPSIVAGLSGAAKLARAGRGFDVQMPESLLIGQLQLVNVDDPDAAIHALHERNAELLRLANVIQPKLLARGGGVRDIEYFKYRLPDGRWTVVLHLLVDTCDAMGANLVNTICEGIAPRIETLTGARAVMKILSNLADRSIVTARVSIPLASLDDGEFGPEFIRDRIILATAFANTDPYRAATHNKGIMNGIDAVALATGNDWRAIEAGAHAFAVRNGKYRSLSKWYSGENGELQGELRLPLKVGTVGGSLHTNPAVGLALRIAGVESATELAAMMAAVGLAQNFAALRALVTHGIQKGHMSLHARSVAAGAGASADIFEEVVQGLIESGEIKSWKADELVRDLQAGRQSRRNAVNSEPDFVGRACGKVILLGEHAAVFDKHVLAVPLPDAVQAVVRPVAGHTTVSIPAWNISQEIAVRQPKGGIAETIALIMRELNVADRHFDIDVEARIPAAMGLGGSAAIAVAIIRAFDLRLGLGLNNRAVDALAFECEKLAHGTPSGIDNNLATYGEPVLYTRSTASRTKPLQLQEVPPLVVAASGQRGMTREMVAGVRRRHARNSALYDTLFNEIDELSVAGSVALRERQYAELGSMMNVCQGFLNALEVSTPELETMIHIARANGALGAKLTGAGGGGSIVALCPQHGEDVANALKQAGYAIIRFRES